MARPKADQPDLLLHVKFVSSYEYYDKLAFNMNWKLDAQKYVPSLLTCTVTSLILTQSNVRPAIFMLHGPDDFLSGSVGT